MKKIKSVLSGEFQLDKAAISQIKKKYSIDSAKERLVELLKSI